VVAEEAEEMTYPTLRRRKKLPRCISCEKPILRSEPDVILESLTVGGRLMFHERCALDACMAVVGGEPGA
jgi:hypothetical protein